jgi:hypothetical protein
VESGGSVAYIAEAPVFHIHDETWGQTRRRYERESVALRVIMPEVRITFVDMCRYIAIAIANDVSVSVKNGEFIIAIVSIFWFRTAQYYGSYKGNKMLKFDADQRRESYFYPKDAFRK